MSDDKEFGYSHSDFVKVRAQLIQLTGIRLGDSKESMVYSRLVRRIRALKLSGFKAYLDYFDKTPAEAEHFINALTTNLTSFFREPHHFDILADYLKDTSGKMTIWCAACSTGEEPYSIAMTLVETLGRFDLPISIIASDIDSRVLETAQKGVYSIDRVSGLEKSRLRQFFHRGKGNQQGKVKVVKELQKLITFKKINLMNPNWGVSDNLDIIFCRNVMIYFDKPTQLSIVNKMVALMKPTGLYIAGHSENFSALSNILKPVGRTVYRPIGGKH